MAISAIFIAYQGDSWLPKGLMSLSKASREIIHLILVDNSGNSIIDDLDLSSFNLEMLKTPYPMGFAEANNYALINASHLEENILFLNQDTISTEGWIDDCVKALKNHSRLGAVSPLIRDYNDENWDPSFLDCLSKEQIVNLPNKECGRVLNEQMVYAKHLPAPALIVRRDVLKEIGPFDTLFGSYYEDYDLCRRIAQVGYRLGFCARARMRHFSGGSTKTPVQERKRMEQIIRNRVIHQLRRTNKYRPMKAIWFFLTDLPLRILRGIKKTPSSQPPSVTLKAYLRLLNIFPRLISAKLDNSMWDKYLQEIGWPPHNQS